MVDLVALVHVEGATQTLELFKMSEKDYMQSVIRAAHNLDEKVAFVSTPTVHMFYGGNVMAYVEARIKDGSSLTVRELIGALDNKKDN